MVKNIRLTFIFFSTLVVIFYLIASNLYDTNLLIVKLTFTVLILYYIITFYNSYLSSKNLLEFDVLLLIFFGVFYLSRIVINLTLLDDFNLGENQWSKNHYFKLVTLKNIGDILILTLVAFNFIFIKTNKAITVSNIKSNFSFKLITFLFILGTIGILAKAITFYNIISTYGYFNLYSGANNIPFIIKILDEFFLPSSLLLLLQSKKKKKIFALFALLNLINLLSGIRYEFILNFISMSWLYYKLENKKLSLYNGILFSSLIIFLLQGALIIKFNYDLDLDLISMFFFSQGVSVLVLGYYIDLNTLFSGNFIEGIRHIISPFSQLYYSSLGIITDKNDFYNEKVFALGTRIPHYLDANKFYQGAGTGSSYIAELYSLSNNYLIYFFLILIYFKILKAFYNKICGKNLIIASYFIYGISWITRGPLVYPLIKVFYITSFLILLIILNSILKNKNESYN